MTCSACGEQPKKIDKSFPKAVIEINNPETLVLFRKVVIPVSMGDEATIPPAIGKYYNVLLVYEANNNAYLYSSDGIPTKLTSDVAQELEERIDTVANNLLTETQDRQTADTNLQNSINTVSGNLASEITTRQNADTTLQNNINAEKNAREGADTNLGNRLTTVEGIAATAVQPNDIDKTVMTGLANGTVNTSSVQLTSSKENLKTGSTSTETLSLPVASSTQAGIMNSSTFDSIINNTNNLNAIMNGAVAITGLSASPTQSDLTTAWESETGIPNLINRASVYDVTNDKVWTYYTNDDTWHAASNTTQVTVSTFTNSSEGTIKGSTNNGQVFAENDGTGSVNGWDTLTTAVAGKQDTLVAGSNITINGTTISATDTTYTAGANVSISGNVISATDTTYSDFTGATSGAAGVHGLVPAPIIGETGKYLKSDGTWETITMPTVNDATLTIQQNGVNVTTFTANSSTNTTANITSPVITMTDTDPGEGSALADNNFVGVYGGTPLILDYSTSEVNTGAKWIDGSDIYKKTVSCGALPNNTTKNVAHDISNLSTVVKFEGYAWTGSTWATLPYVTSNGSSQIGLRISPTNVIIVTSSDRSSFTPSYVTIYYTKSS